MKKLLGTFLFLGLLLLFAACTSPDEDTRPNLPHRVWESWEEMKEVLGDHYLYPMYLPEYTARSRQFFKISHYNHHDRNWKPDELFFGYIAVFWSGNTMDDFIEIRATDYGRRNRESGNRSLDFPATLENPARFNEHTVTIGGIDIEFFTLYGTLPPPQGTTELEQWHTYHARNTRVVYYSFTIGTVTYFMQWSQYDVEDKYADDEQREGMLRVAKSIIEQVREVE